MGAPPRPPPPAATTSLDPAVLALREVILASEHYRLVLAAHFGLTVNESQALSYLAARGPLGQTELGNALGFTTSSVTGLVDRLEQAGVVARTPHPGDRRRVIITIRPTGDHVVSTSRELLSRACSAVDGIGGDDLTVALHQIADSLRAQTDSLDTDNGDPPRRRRPRRRL